ncbi:hypothetical protein OG874_06475 [Nocardia sp. NBC_00565]|uniref:trypco2 family protein n=1 Tax=Nocardia sp. NBC_00565 TaxID=2975993 RepID=UPI002E812751|nr:trypco2 family protein [Nocardia sp. NBC_00565]WUC04811.1 hypothetical protein OG874_06475 [Nocardia sp. NBC_00565]
MSDRALVGLADAIRALREELTSAMQDGWNQPMRFGLEPIELTVEAAVTKDAHGQIGWKIIEFGGTYEKARTQTLKLLLTPMWGLPDGTTTQDFSIASMNAEGDRFGPVDAGAD